MSVTRTLLAGSFLVAFTAAAGADNEFIRTWKSPDAGPLNFSGRKVAAVVIVDDADLEVAAEEALSREIAARGPNAVPAYRIVPRPELAKKESARAWLEKAGVEGLVAMRVVGVDTRTTYSSAVVFSSGYYANAWDYWGYGWTSVYPLGKGKLETTLTVETLLFDLSTGAPVWAGVSVTTNVKDHISFMKLLAGNIGKQLQKAGLSAK
jgi:hypothetical protein